MFHKSAHLFGNSLQSVILLEVIQNCHELITAPASDRVCNSQRIADCVGNHAQSFVACVMPVCVIDLFEIIHIHEQESGSTRIVLVFGDHCVQASIEMHANANSGKSVGRCHMTQLQQFAAS